MSITLTKRAEKVGIILAKRGLAVAPVTRVGVALDVSGSTQGLYSNGVMQETLDRLQAVALKFDDNGELDMWAFSTSTTQLETATAEDEGKYLKENIKSSKVSELWGGTSYAPALQDAINFWYPTGIAGAAAATKSFFGGLFSKKAAAPVVETVTTKAPPAMLLFVTDGSTNDESLTERILSEAQAHPDKQVYFNFVGVGSAHHFQFLERMADKFDNVGFVNLETLSVTDDELYEALVSTEFVAWIKKVN